MPDFVGRSAEIWVLSYLRADLVPHRARAVPARGGARLRQAARPVLILRSAREARVSRRMGRAGMASCFETHRSESRACGSYVDSPRCNAPQHEAERENDVRA